MARVIVGVTCGFVAWFVAATLGNLVLRMTLEGYTDVEKTMTFTTGMMVARLVLGAVSSFCAGVAVAWITRRNPRAVAAVIVLLLVLFVPVHVGLWRSFPAWYHLVFLGMLALMTLAGAAAYPRSTDRVNAPQSGS